MLFDMLIIFVILSVIFFIISVFLMEDKPMIAIPFIMLGMIFCVLCTYGFWNVEYFYVGYNSTVGNTSSYIYSTTDYGNPYSYVFMVFFYIYVLLFIRSGWNMWKEALETKGEMDYRKRDNRWSSR